MRSFWKFALTTMFLFVSSSGEALYFGCCNSIPIEDEQNRKKYPEEFINSDNYPWRTVGGLSGSPTEIFECTAVLVGPNLVLTSAHCIISGEDGSTVMGKGFVSFNGKDARYSNAASKIGKRIPVSPISGPTQGGYGDKDEWYILQLSESIGYELGWMGVLNSKGEILPGNEGRRAPHKTEPTYFAENICANESSPYPDFITMNLQKNAEPWAYDYTIEQLDKLNPYICLAGFPSHYPFFKKSEEELKLNPRERPHDYILSHTCWIRGNRNEAFVHDCGSAKGGSGSPLFYTHAQWGPLVVGINARNNSYKADGKYFSLGDAETGVGAYYNVATMSDAFFDELKRLRKQSEGSGFRSKYDRLADSYKRQNEPRP